MRIFGVRFRSLRKRKPAVLLLKAFQKSVNSPAAQTAQIFGTTQKHSRLTFSKTPANAPQTSSCRSRLAFSSLGLVIGLVADTENGIKLKTIKSFVEKIKKGVDLWR